MGTVCVGVCLLLLGVGLGGHAFVLNDIDVDTDLVHRVQKRQAACGGKVTLEEGEGQIQLPTTDVNGTQFYGAELHCTWDVEALPGQQILITSEYFSLEMSEACQWDFVEIRENTSGKTSRYCGWDMLTYISGDHDVTISFTSDVSYEDRGFKFIASAVSPAADDSHCNQAILAQAGETGDIRNQAESNSSCFYSIQAPDDYVVELSVTSLQFGAKTCAEENIVVHTGHSSHGESIWKICNDDTTEVVVKRDQAFFVSYNNPTGNEGDRFQLTYTVVADNFTPAPAPVTTPSPVGGDNDCSGMIRDSDSDTHEFTYTSPTYEDNRECVIVARTSMKRHLVQVEFLKFDLEDSENCEFDSLRVFSGERKDSMEMGGPYCGTTLKGKTFMSNGNSLTLSFKTDESFALYGFKARISFVPEGCFCEGKGVCVRQEFEKRCLAEKKCHMNMCQNGGTCVASGGSSTCYCPDGFYGQDCSDSDGSIGHVKFTDAPQDQAVERNKQVSAWCGVEAPPGETADITWYFKNNPLPEYTKSNKMGSKLGGILRIDEFDEELEGMYACVATLSDTSAEHTFELSLVEECALRIELGPGQETVNVGDPALLACFARGVQNVQWKKDEMVVQLDSRITRKGTYLNIADARLSDAGKYRCEVTDSDGCTTYKEGELHVVNVKPTSEFCGMSVFDEKKSGRIMTGSDAKPNDNPWHVTLLMQDRGGQRSPFCGGTLISRRFVVTAAHCVTGFQRLNGLEFNPENVLLLFGTTGCRNNWKDETRRFKQVHVHPTFNTTVAYDSDIALLELEEPVKYGTSIRPICLRDEIYVESEFFKRRNSVGKIAGCGLYRRQANGKTSEVLQEIKLPYVTREDCQQNLEGENHSLTDNMICAGYKRHNKGDVCRGDSGGGMVMLDRSNHWVLTGIVSWGIGRCDRGYYSVFTNVASFYDWIEEKAMVSEEALVIV